MRAIYSLVDTGDARRRPVASMAGGPRAPTETDAETGEEYLSIPDVCGPFAWSVLHRWAHREGAVLGDPWAGYLVHITTAIHDAVNAKLRKPLRDPDNLARMVDLLHDAESYEFNGADRAPFVPPSIGFVEDWAEAVNDDMCSACGGWAKLAAAAAVDGARYLGRVRPVNAANVAAVAAVFEEALAGTLADRFAEAHQDGKGCKGGSVGANLKCLPVEERRRIWAARKRAQRAHVCPDGKEIHHPDYTDLSRYECVTPGEHRKLVHMAQESDPYGSRCRGDGGQFVDRAECGDAAPNAVGVPAAGSSETFAIGPNGLTRYEFRFRVRDVRSLTISHDPFTFEENPRFPPVLQPRDRGRAANREQVMGMAVDLSPMALLVDYRSLDRGAPIVGPDGIVESGNGRAMAVAHAALQYPDSYGGYLSGLRTVLPEYGLSAADLEGVETPILVRERVTELTPAARTRFVQEANGRATLGASAVETAKADAARLSMAAIQELEVGDDDSIFDALAASRNRDFVVSFLAGLPQQERAALVTSGGALSQDGLRRVAMAVFVRAFPGEDGLTLAERAFESIDDDVKAAIAGVSRALGPLVQAETLVRSGARDEGLALAGDLARAIHTLAKVRTTPGLTVPRYLSQGQLGGARELTQFQEALLSWIDAKPRSAKRYAGVLRRYAAGVLAASPPSQGGLFGDVVGPTRDDLWRRAVAGEAGEREEAPRRPLSGVLVPA